VRCVHGLGTGWAWAGRGERLEKSMSAFPCQAPWMVQMWQMNDLLYCCIPLSVQEPLVEGLRASLEISHAGGGREQGSPVSGAWSHLQ
jgi:hypothetical protein